MASHFHGYTPDELEDQDPPWANFLPPPTLNPNPLSLPPPHQHQVYQVQQQQPLPSWYQPHPPPPTTQIIPPSYSEEDYVMHQQQPMVQQPSYYYSSSSASTSSTPPTSASIHSQENDHQSSPFSPLSNSYSHPNPPGTIDYDQNQLQHVEQPVQYEFAYDPTLPLPPATAASSSSSSSTSLYSAFFNGPSPATLHPSPSFGSPSSLSHSLPPSSRSSRPTSHSQPPTRNSSFSKLSGMSVNSANSMSGSAGVGLGVQGGSWGGGGKMGGSAPGTPSSGHLNLASVNPVGGGNGYFGMEKFIPQHPHQQHAPPVAPHPSQHHPHPLSNPLYHSQPPSQPPPHLSQSSLQQSLLLSSTSPNPQSHPRPPPNLRLSTSFPARPPTKLHNRSVSYAPSSSSSSASTSKKSSLLFQSCPECGNVVCDCSFPPPPSSPFSFNSVNPPEPSPTLSSGFGTPVSAGTSPFSSFPSGGSPFGGFSVNEINRRGSSGEARRRASSESLWSEDSVRAGQGGYGTRHSSIVSNSIGGMMGADWGESSPVGSAGLNAGEGWADGSGFFVGAVPGGDGFVGGPGPTSWTGEGRDQDMAGAAEVDEGMRLLDLDKGVISGDLEGSIKAYIRAPNRLQVGERSLLVLNPRIVQRSYGTEKRFLCPQPMALLLGASWWSNVEYRPPGSGSSISSTPLTRINAPPQVFITIGVSPVTPTPASTNANGFGFGIGLGAITNPQQPSHGGKREVAVTTWMGVSGAKLGATDEEDEKPDKEKEQEMVISGRAVGKGAYVSAMSDPGRDRVIRAEVTVVAPGGNGLGREGKMIGVFEGKPMTVISKPSKRRQAASSCMTLQHGNLVSLYNRIKSQTGSTRFLGVSGSSSSFPAMDWRAMTGGQPRPYAPADSYSTTFVARTASWDAFVIYAVDLNLPTLDPNLVPAPAPYSGYPRPPVNAVPFDLNTPKGIYYNMPIVLQCLATAVVSPVMIIRKIEAKSTAVGGGSIDGYTPRHAQHLPCAPGEQLGEPVSQFRPLAFEIYSDHSKERTTPEGAGKTGRQQPQNTFLACLGEHIGINQSRDTRKPLPSLETNPNVSGSPNPAFRHDGSPPPPGTPTSDGGTPLLSGGADYDEDHTANGAKVKKLRRLSSSSNMGGAPYPMSSSTNAGSSGGSPIARPSSALSKHKRRGVSLSSLTQIKTEASDELLSSLNLESPSRWTIDCGDPCVWTIAAVDVARHTFYVPPEVIGGKSATAHPPPPTTDPLYRTPIPSVPIRPLIPVIADYDPPSFDPSRAGSDEASMITLYGENFSSHYRVWLGESPCPGQIIKSSNEMLVVPPPLSAEVEEPVSPPQPLSTPLPTGLRISLVRNDGVVFPSSLYYRAK